MENQKNYWKVRKSYIKAHKLENNPQFTEFVAHTDDEAKAAVAATEAWKKEHA